MGKQEQTNLLPLFHMAGRPDESVYCRSAMSQLSRKVMRL